MDHDAKGGLVGAACSPTAPSQPPTYGFNILAAPGVTPYNVTAVFDEFNKVARLSWKSLLTDIEGFRVGKKIYIRRLCMRWCNHGEYALS